MGKIVLRLDRMMVERKMSLAEPMSKGKSFGNAYVDYCSSCYAIIKDKQKTRVVNTKTSMPFLQSGQNLFPSVVLLWSNKKSPPSWR